MLGLRLHANALVVLFVALVLHVNAHSTPPRPLKRLTHPSTLALEILPRYQRRDVEDARSPILLHSDSFRLTLSAFGQTFHLHLRPNEYLVHPHARIVYPSASKADPQVLPLLKDRIRAYDGQVIAPSSSLDRLREDAATYPLRPLSDPSVLGWARIMVHDQGSVEGGKAPVYEGAFSVHGTIYHIMLKDNYETIYRHPLDPAFPNAEQLDEVDSHLVIWRDSDVMSPTDLMSQPQGHTCAHDTLSYNTDPLQNPILRRVQSSQMSSSSAAASWVPAPILDSLGNLTLSLGMSKRDDVQGNGMTSNFANTIGNSAGCPTDQQILYMGVAADCVYVSQYGSRENATRQILNDWNTASALFKSTFNVSLGIVELYIQDPTCPSTPDPNVQWNVGCAAPNSTSGTTLNERLSMFSAWRGNKGGSDGAGLWHLMSGCPTGTEVGIAWLATLCLTTASGDDPNVVSGTAVSTSGRTEWQVVAHEIGHNFGAIHDCADGCNSISICCPLSTSSCDASSQFIMSPVAEASEKIFSQCSLGNICSLMQGNNGATTNTTCLIPASLQSQSNSQTSSGQTIHPLITLQMCGNGIVDDGEDCDPGSNITSPCCDSSTCKFKNGAVCDFTSSTCCTNSCAFASSSTICRPSKDAKCDTAEKCRGNSAECPADVVAPNGQSCGDNDLACASGLCTSVSLQCQTVGASMGLKKACTNRSDNTCQISCQDPNQSTQCILLSSLLIDGSPCGYGGMCKSGKCQSGSAFDTAKAWYTQNLQIAIPVTVVAGLIALLIIWRFFRALRGCCTRPGRRYAPRPLTLIGEGTTGMHERLGSSDGARPVSTQGGLQQRAPYYPAPSPSGNISASAPPPVYTSTRPRGTRSRHDRSKWVDEALYNGARAPS